MSSSTGGCTSSSIHSIRCLGYAPSTGTKPQPARSAPRMPAQVRPIANRKKDHMSENARMSACKCTRAYVHVCVRQRAQGCGRAGQVGAAQAHSPHLSATRPCRTTNNKVLRGITESTETLSAATGQDLLGCLSRAVESVLRKIYSLNAQRHIPPK